MSFEVDKLFEEYQRQKGRQFDTYQHRAHNPMFDSIIGYVADVTEQNRLRNAYSVIVPSFQNAMLRDVPRKIPDGFINANGVGHLPPPLRPGQPVLIRFINNRSTQPYIDGGFTLNGQLELWTQDKIPQLDQKDSTNLALFPSPLPPEAQAVKGDAEVKVYPLILRLSSPTQPKDSATALEVPGTTYITDTYGNVFTYFAGERIVVGKNEQKVTAGSRQSMADMPKEEAVKKAIRMQAQMLESLANWRTSLGGEFTIQTPHPASKRQRSGLESGSLTISQSGISGELNINTGVTYDTSSLQSAFSTVDNITSLLSSASKIGGKQMEFLQKTILPLINKIKGLWGSNGGFGLQQLSFQVDLPFNLKLSVAIKFDTKTGKLSIKAQLGFGSGTPIAGSQPLPLRSEGTLIAGGYQRQVDNQIVVKTTITEYFTSTIYQDFPELDGFRPQTLDSSTIPYTYVSRDLNDLNFGVRPYDALSSLVTQYGVPEADRIIRYLVPLVKYGSAFDFLKIGAVLGDPLQTVVITTGITTNGGITVNNPSELSPEITEIIETVNKPAVISCPTLPDETYRILYLAQKQEREAAESSLATYFQISIPDYASWIEDLDNFLEWALAEQHPFYPALYWLRQGDLLNFFVLLTYLKTGIDIRAYPRAFAELKEYVHLAFVMPRAGVV